MTFLQIRQAILTDRFDPSQDGDCKNWVNDAYGYIWGLEEWTFRYATSLVSVTTGSKTVGGLPTDLSVVRSFQRGDGTPLDSLDPVSFDRLYYDARTTWTGLPEAYKNVNGVLSVGPASSETASDYNLIYEKA